MMGLAYLTPMTVFDTFGIVSGLTDGHVPTSYLLALVGVLFTAISYGKLVRQFPTAGSAYTYAQKAINPHVGFLVGWSSLLDYLFLPMINTLLAKIYLTALFPEVPPWVWVVGFVILITAINLKASIWWPTSIPCSCWRRWRSFWCSSTWWCAACTTARDGHGVEPAAVPQ